jgi:hypothetical protein
MKVNDDASRRAEFVENWPPARPPAWDDTIPTPFGVCIDCIEDRHQWTSPGMETIGEHTVHRFRCDCEHCFGRCDGLRTMLPTGQHWGGLHRRTHRPAPTPLTIALPPHHTLGTATETRDDPPFRRRTAWFPQRRVV